ncbi:MAG: sensor histidine kinase, partial [Gemmatimonadota bacterium]
LVERYLAIESIRFQDRLDLELDFPSELDGARVPHFILQPLVENAFKHGLSRSTEATRLRLSARRDGSQLILEVENGGPVPASGPSAGFGLAATRRRLKHIYGSQASLTLAPGPGGDGALATITMPWNG